MRQSHGGQLQEFRRVGLEIRVALGRRHEVRDQIIAALELGGRELSLNSSPNTL